MAFLSTPTRCFASFWSESWRLAGRLTIITSFWSQLRCEGGEPDLLCRWVGGKKKTDALNPLDLKEPDVRVVPDRRIHVATKRNQREKKTRSLLKLKPWQPNAYSTLVGLVWDRCLFFHVNLPTASLLLSRSTHTASQLNRRGMFTVGRWLPTCMCGTTWPCRRWPGTSWWGWDGGRAGGRRACRAEGTWGFLTRPSNPWGRQQDLIRPKLFFFFLSSSVNVFRIKFFSLAHLRSSWTACVSWTKMSLTSPVYSLLTVSSRSSYVVMSSEDKRRTLRLVPLHNQCMNQ